METEIDTGNHTMSIIGWSVGRVHPSLLNQPNDESKTRMVDVPYWICRNNWSTNENTGLFVHTAMYPYNKLLNMEGIGSKFVSDTDTNTLIHETIENAVFLFKAGDIRNQSSQFTAASDKIRVKLDQLYKLDHTYMQQRDPIIAATITIQPPVIVRGGADDNDDDFDRHIFSEILPYTKIYSKGNPAMMTSLVLSSPSSSSKLPSALSSPPIAKLLEVIIIIVIVIVLIVLLLLFL